MIKVLRIINRFNLGGPTYNVTYLTAYLSPEFETKLVGGGHEEYEGGSTFILDKHNVQHEIVSNLQRTISFRKDKKALANLREIIREYQPDIVHTHASKAGFLGRLAASKEKVPIIVHTFHGHVFHSYFGKLKTLLYKNLERRMAKKSDAIIAISEIQKKELWEIHKITAEEKIRVIPLGFDLEKFGEGREERRANFRNKHNVQQDELAIGIIGRLTSIKNHNLFLDAIEIAIEKIDSQIKVFIIGDGELMGELKKKAEAIENRIGRQVFIFTSWIKNVEEALPGLDLVCLSSLNEGTPVSLIEAQAAGIPVISTNVGGVRNVIAHEDTGLIVDSFSAEEYAKAVVTLVNSEKSRQKMSQNGWNHVKDKFHYTRLCKDVEELYKELLNKKGISK